MKTRRLILLSLLLLLLVSLPSHSQDRFYQVKRVVDGDTLLLTNGERVKLIGVDTPEVHESKKLYRDAERTGRDIKTIKALGRKASAFTKSSVDRKEVRLEYDQANSHIKHRDKYGRILAYVHLEDGTFVNAEILSRGMGLPTLAFRLSKWRSLGDMRGRRGRINEVCGVSDWSGY